MTGFSRRRLMAAGLAAVGGAVVAGPLQSLGAMTAGATTEGAGTVSSVTLPPVTLPSVTPPSVTPPSMTLARWQALVGQSFRVTGRGWHHSVVLRSAAALRPDSLLAGDGYILLFRGARHDAVPAATCVVRHGAIGAFSAALLPVDQPTANQSYQLIVDRRRPVAPIRR